MARSINSHRSRGEFLIGNTVAVECTFNGVDKVAFIYDSRSSKVRDYELEPASVSLCEHGGQIDAVGIIKESGKSFDFKGFSPKDFGGANCSTIEVEFENTENTLSAMALTTTVLGDEYREILSALKENSVLYNKARSMPGFAELEKMLETPKNTKVLRLY